METKKIKILRDTACETLEGIIVPVAKDAEIEVPARAANRLIELGSAESIEGVPPKTRRTSSKLAEGTPST